MTTEEEIGLARSAPRRRRQDRDEVYARATRPRADAKPGSATEIWLGQRALPSWFRRAAGAREAAPEVGRADSVGAGQSSKSQNIIPCGQPAP
jgi:hypothetical protein